MAQAIIYKRTTESSPFSFDFTDLLNPAEQLDSSSSVSVTDSQGLDQTNFIVQKVDLTTGSGGTNTQLRALLQNGLDGEDYLVVFKGIGATSKYSFDLVLELRVRNRVTGNL